MYLVRKIACEMCVHAVLLCSEEMGCVQYYAKSNQTPTYIGEILRRGTQNLSYIPGSTLIYLAYPYANYHSSIYRRDFAWGYAKSLLCILERFCVPLRKISPIYMGVILCRGTQNVSYN